MKLSTPKAGEMKPTGGEALLVGLFVSMFVDQGISEQRMLQLLRPKKLSAIYRMIEGRK